MGQRVRERLLALEVKFSSQATWVSTVALADLRIFMGFGFLSTHDFTVRWFHWKSLNSGRTIPNRENRELAHSILEPEPKVSDCESANIGRRLFGEI